MITIDYRSRVPIFDQIVSGIMQLKAMGVLSAGDKLPSVRALAGELGVNPNTVQKSYAILESSGVIYSVAGKGSFISLDDAAMEAIVAAARAEFLRAVEKAKAAGLSEKMLADAVKDVFKGGEEL